MVDALENRSPLKKCRQIQVLYIELPTYDLVLVPFTKYMYVESMVSKRTGERGGSTVVLRSTCRDVARSEYGTVVC